MSEHCIHTDRDFLRSAQLADDEIEICSYMAADGRCPICNSENEDAYTEAVKFRREGHVGSVEPLELSEAEIQREIAGDEV